MLSKKCDGALNAIEPRVKEGMSHVALLAVSEFDAALSGVNACYSSASPFFTISLAAPSTISSI